MPKILRLLSLVCILVAGCSRPTTSQTSSAPVASSVVELPPSYKFEPAHVTVAAGTTVTWTNHDNFTHSVQVDGQRDVHMLRPGDSAQITFDAPGEYHYICTLHTQNMQGSVTVT